MSMRPRRTRPIRGARDQIHPVKVLTNKEKSAIEEYLKNRWSGENKPQSRRDVAAFKELLMFELLLATGMRRMEICNLRLKDCPEWLGENAVYIYRSKNAVDRTIPLSSRVCALLALYISNYRPYFLKRHVGRQDGDKCVFYSKLKRPYNVAGVNYLVRRWGVKAGLKKIITPHKFRHTFATDNLSAEVRPINVRQLQYLLGHSSMMTTAKYVHYLAAHKVGLGEILDRRQQQQKDLSG